MQKKKMPSSLPFLLLFFMLFLCVVNGVQLIIVNNCNETIWPGILATSSQATPLGGGFSLGPGRHQLLQLSLHWSGRIWARQGCRFDRHSRGTCETGDCGGALRCRGTAGAPPATVVEMTFGSPMWPLHFYDVSLVDGFNLPASVVPLGGSGDRCGVAACEADLNGRCPPWLAVRGHRGTVVGCRSPCLATGLSRFCCTGEFAGPEKCPATVIGRMFKTACPRAYSHPFDEATGLKTCRATRYVVTFCPP